MDVHDHATTPRIAQLLKHVLSLELEPDSLGDSYELAESVRVACDYPEPNREVIKCVAVAAVCVERAALWIGLEATLERRHLRSEPAVAWSDMRDARSIVNEAVTIPSKTCSLADTRSGARICRCPRAACRDYGGPVLDLSSLDLEEIA